MTFEQLALHPSILKALKEENYTNPTPIQEQAIPLVLEHNDILGCAQTGTGKTAAFAIPILQQLLAQPNTTSRKKISTLVLTPTRELAIQIGESFTSYAKHTALKNTVIFGGVSKGAQIRAVRNGVDVLVATPGRLLDLMNEGVISLNDIKYFVLDEADRMLDMGFINDIKEVISKLPTKRQSLFFSATMPNNIVTLSNTILKHPKKIEITPVSSAATTIQQFVYFTNKPDKGALLLHILEDEKMDQVLLFSRTKHGADKIVRNLKKKQIKAAAIHGDKAQNQRQKALTFFKEGTIRVLVATDIAARGIDIDKLKYVINYDVPNLPETYVHRIGRSGRAGEEGIAISLAEPEENVFVKDIEKLISKKITVITDTPFPQTDKPMTEKERKAAEKEKNRKKQEFFANRKKQQQNNGNSRGGNRRR